MNAAIPKRPFTPPSLARFAWTLVFSFSCIAIGRAQSTDLSGIAHVAFRVTSIQNTRNFYQQLGFEQAFAITRSGTTAQAFIKINDRQFIELYPETPRNTTLGFMHLCFQSPDINALHAQYLQRGLSPTRVRKAGAGNLLFTLAGPEQQNIEYTQYMPGSLHENDDSKHLGPDRIAKQFTSVALAMHDPSAADAFYIDKLSFHPHRSHHSNLLLLPGNPNQSVQFKPEHDTTTPDITFAVANLHSTIKALKSKGFAVHTARYVAYITDPDGNHVGFVASDHQPN